MRIYEEKKIVKRNKKIRLRLFISKKFNLKYTNLIFLEDRKYEDQELFFMAIQCNTNYILDTGKAENLNEIFNYLKIELKEFLNRKDIF